ncbi:MAG: DUF433 domain-containing protein [Phycisphaeraceae bacterium]|nr:DUF433 domain-containing protein [Phycisphaeraceae bacterium]MBX3407881.1 DUF433 domain-containing protein [Phycisphaeraceae bacterium]
MQKRPFDYWQHISRDPQVMGGEAVMTGTRVPLRTVLASLADGMQPAEVIREFPVLTPAHIHAAIAYAADSAREDLPSAPLPKVA